MSVRQSWASVPVSTALRRLGHQTIHHEMHPVFIALIDEIVRFIAEATPYDPEWEASCAQRLGVKMEATPKGRRHLLRVGKEQDGMA